VLFIRKIRGETAITGVKNYNSFIYLLLIRGNKETKRKQKKKGTILFSFQRAKEKSQKQCAQRRQKQN